MLQKLSGAIENALLRFHSANPAATGMSKEALRQACMPRCAPDAFDAVLARACMEGKAVADGGMISHPQAGAGARMLEEGNAEKLAELLAAAGSKPPTVADLLKQADLAPKQGYKALGLLEKQGRAIKASENSTSTPPRLPHSSRPCEPALANGPASRCRPQRRHGPESQARHPRARALRRYGRHAPRRRRTRVGKLSKIRRSEQR